MSDRHFPPLFRAAGLGSALAGALFALLGCTGTSTVGTFPLPATAIVVDPADFLGDVPCLDEPGAMQRYVATLFSHHAGGALDADVLALPSSPPTSCREPVSFQRVVDGTAYFAEIDGYDTTDLVPLGADGGSPGSRIMVDHQGRYVAPRWTTSCANGDEPRTVEADAAPGKQGDAGAALDAGRRPKDASTDTGAPYGRCTGHLSDASAGPDPRRPVCAVANLVIPIRGCEPLREVGHTPTRLTVDLADTFGTAPDGGACLRCGSGPGEISRFKVELVGSSTPARWATCGSAAAPFDVPAGSVATFAVTAYGAGIDSDGGACTSDGGTLSDAGAEIPDADVCAAVSEANKGSCGTWYTECLGQPLTGLTRRATCYLLGTNPERRHGR